MVDFTCPKCGKTLRIRSELSCRKVRCGNCKAAIDIPNPELVYLANFCQRFKRQDDAGKLLHQAVALDPKHAKAHCELGLLYRDQGQLAKALKSLQTGHMLGSKLPNWKEPSGKWLSETASVLGNLILKGRNDEKRARAAMKLADPWERLAAAYHITENQAAFDKLTTDQPRSLVGLAKLYAELKDGKRALSYCQKLLQSPDAANRIAALTTMQEMSAFAKDTIPQLLETLGDKDTLVRKQAHQALVSLGEPAVHALVARLKHESPIRRLQAAVALAEFGLLAKSALPELKLILKDKDKAVSQAAAQTIAAINAGPREFRGTLATTDPFDRIRGTSYHKVHTVQLQAGRSYQIDLTGSFDTFLRLEDSIGRLLSFDDDGGEGLNSRMIFVPKQTAKYRLIVTSYRAGAVGNYTLTVRPLNAGAVNAQKAKAKLAYMRLLVTTYQRSLAANPNNYDTYYFLGHAHLGAGDLDKYRNLTAQFLARFKDTKVPAIASRMVFTAFAHPEPSDYFKKLLPLAKLGAAAFSGNERVVAATLYRAGQPKKAVQQFAISQQKFQPRAWDYLFLAMAHHKLGDTPRATQYANLAVRWMQLNRPGDWTEGLQLEMLAVELGRMDAAYGRILGLIER